MDRVGGGILSEKEVGCGVWDGTIENHRTEDGGLGKTSRGKTKRRRRNESTN